jgi:hypothetical protein
MANYQGSINSLQLDKLTTIKITAQTFGAPYLF